MPANPTPRSVSTWAAKRPAAKVVPLQHVPSTELKAVDLREIREGLKPTGVEERVFKSNVSSKTLARTIR